MSLHLQALKKAEEAKRLREAAAAAPEQAAADGGLELAFEPVNEASVQDLPSPEPAPEPLAVEEWQFVPLAEPEPGDAEPPAAVIELPQAEPQADLPAAEDDLTWLKQAPEPELPPPLPPPASAPAPVVSASPPAPVILPKKAAPTSKLPWLLLSGVLMAAGVAGYFWWQYQSLQPLQPVVAPAAPPAAAPEAAEPAADQPAAPAALAPAPAIQAIATPEPAVQPSPAIPPSTRLSGTDAASVKERSSAPNGAGVRFDSQQNELAVPVQLQIAYRAYQAGDDRLAGEAYRQMLQLDARNRDALLGLAVLATKRGDTAEAAQYYQQLLKLNPRDEVAQAGLYALTPNSAEANLRQLSSQQAGAAFALAHLYAGQGRWSEAQSAYFQALTLDSSNADYAFNLAVSLEHLQQPKMAARYYRQALGGKGTFERSIAEERLKTLETP